MRPRYKSEVKQLLLVFTVDRWASHTNIISDFEQTSSSSRYQNLISVPSYPVLPYSIKCSPPNILHLVQAMLLVMSVERRAWDVYNLHDIFGGRWDSEWQSYLLAPRAAQDVIARRHGASRHRDRGRGLGTTPERVKMYGRRSTKGWKTTR